MSETTIDRMSKGDLLQTLDAKVWAEQFAKRFPNGGYTPEDLLGWFTTAIMAGYDHGVRRMQDEVNRHRASITLRDERLECAYNRVEEAEYQLRIWQSLYAMP